MNQGHTCIVKVGGNHAVMALIFNAFEEATAVQHRVTYLKPIDQ